MQTFIFYDNQKVITIRAKSFSDAQSILFNNHFTTFLRIFGSD